MSGKKIESGNSPLNHMDKSSGKRNGGQKKLPGIYLTGILVIIVFAVIHLMDVRAGAAGSKDGWLVGNYIALSIAALAGTAGLGWLFFYEKGWPLERIYLISCMVYGMLYLMVLPPLSAPDEVSHYISAYKLSNQMMGKPATHEDGHVLVRSEDLFIEDIYGERLRNPDSNHVDSKVLGQELTEETYSILHDMEWFSGGDGEIAVSSQPPVRTTPLAYIPQAAGITLARLFHMGSIGLLYLGRLMNLIFYGGVVYLAMKRMPFGKEVMFGVAMLPMTLHLAGSMSYDVMILAMSFYFTAICLDLAFARDRVRIWDVLLLAGIMAVLGPCKMVYGGIMGLCLLIPVKKFGGWKNYLVSAFAVLGVFMAAMILVNTQTIAAYATETESYVAWAEEAGYSLTMLIHNPGLLFKMFYNTLIWQAEHYHLTMIGAYLGNIDLVLDVPYLLVVFLSLCLMGLSFRKPGESIVISGGKRVWIWVLCLSCAGLTCLSMLIAWTPVSSLTIAGVQGRYFLPILPIFLLTIKNNLIVLSKNVDRTILFMMCCVNAYGLLRLFSIVSIRL